MWLLIKLESVQKQPLLSHLKSLQTKTTIIIILLSLLIVSVQDTNSLMTSWQAHWYGSVSLLSTRSLSSGHYRLLLRPFPWQQHDWCLLLAIRTNSLEANHDCPVVCCCGLKTDSVVIIKGRDFSQSEAPKTARHFPLGYVHSTPFSREAQLSSSLSALSQAQVADISRQQKEQEGVGGGGALKDTVVLTPRRRCDAPPAAGRSPSSARWSFCPGRCSEATPSPTRTAPPSLCPDGLQARKHRNTTREIHVGTHFSHSAGGRPTQTSWVGRCWHFQQCIINISSVLTWHKNTRLTFCFGGRRLVLQYRIMVQHNRRCKEKIWPTNEEKAALQ